MLVSNIHRNAGLIIILLLISVHPAEGLQLKPDHLAFSTVQPETDSLQIYAEKINDLWTKKESDLNLAAEVMIKITGSEKLSYHKMAADFYLWSILNASFDEEKEAITGEVQRLLPLLDESSRETWQKYLNEENPLLLREIAGFWEVSDPYSATTLNERLIEHWQRINYAQANFNRVNKKPYHTDDRGIIYVRLGPPDKIIKRDITFSQVIDPLTGQRLTFALGSLIHTELEIWEYKNSDGEDYFFLFGPENGSGQFGLRNNLLELVDTHSTEITFENSYWVSPSKINRITETALQLGLYEKLAPYHSFFNRMYSELETMLTRDYGLGTHTRFYLSNYVVDFKTYHHLTRQHHIAPPNTTTLKNENQRLSVYTKTYRFLNEAGETEYIVGLQPDFTETDSTDNRFLSNKLYMYDADWQKLTETDDLNRAASHIGNQASLYHINDYKPDSHLYFSSEIIDTSFNKIKIPGSINPKTSSIVRSSGKQELHIPKPLENDRPLLISDIIMGVSQNPNPDARVPVSPSLDKEFDPDSKLMIYLEAYNVPEEGYSFSYYFEEERKLLGAVPAGKKRVRDKTEVTILADDVENRDWQFFTLDLEGLEAGKYSLVFQFNALGTSPGIEVSEKRIEFIISDNAETGS